MKDTLLEWKGSEELERIVEETRTALQAYIDEADFYGANGEDQALLCDTTAMVNKAQALLCEGLLAYWLVQYKDGDKSFMKSGVKKELDTIKRDNLQELVLPVLFDRALSASRFGMVAGARASAEAKAKAIAPA